ncbi:MAG: rhodanese-like domain-containing protein [Flavobacteriales bacterium]
MFRTLFGMGPKVDLKELKAKGAVILDVRSTAEFASGHVKGAINIPLDRLQQQLKKLPKDKVVIACCLSGGRSGSAVSILKGEGYECYNGGGWSSLDRELKG